MNDILLTRKSPEIQHIVEVNFTEVMHRRGGGLLGTKQGDMEDAIEEACRAQVRKVYDYMRTHWVHARQLDYKTARDNTVLLTIRSEDWQALREAAGGEG